MAFGSQQWMYNAGADYYTYKIPYSCRIDNVSSGAQTFTRSWTGSNTTSTLSVWIKHPVLGTGSQKVLDNSTGHYDQIKDDDTIFGYGASGDEWRTVAQYRDPSAWYHYVKIINSAPSAAADRIKIYINGVQQTLTFSGSNGQGNAEAWSGNNGQIIGSSYSQVYLAEFNYIEGQVKAATDFGETGDYGDWKPKEYTGTYTGNSFYLDFADSGDLGDDESGLGNDWTENGIAANDQMLDTPTSNYPTWNSLYKTSHLVFNEGNLAFEADDTDYHVAISTMGAISGKWYAEFDAVSGISANDKNVGIYRSDSEYDDDRGLGSYPNGLTWSYGAHGQVRQGGTNVGTQATFTDGDIIQVAMDLDNNKLYFGKNNTWINSGDPTSGATGTGAYAIVSATDVHYLFAATSIDSGGAGRWIANFGQDSSFAGNKTAQGNGGAGEDFYYTPPSDYKSLRADNLPAVAVVPSEHYNTVLYTGDSDTSRLITGVGFQPDFIWIKDRDTTCDHRSMNTAMGITKTLRMNTAVAENDDGQVGSVNSDGFELGNDGCVNTPSNGFVSWNWKVGGGAGSSNTNGSINTTTTSVNTDAGISISTYSGTGSSATIGHGLSKAPEWIMTKKTNSTGDWMIQTNNDPTDYLRLNETTATTDSNNAWDDTAPTATVWTGGSDGAINGSGNTYVVFCFHSVDGFSKVGTYLGNANSNGTFVYTGFRPAFLLLKELDGGQDWGLYDSKRAFDYNADDGGGLRPLRPDGNGAERGATAGRDMDFVSNGFKLRDSNATFNGSSKTYFYLAFAETPFKYSNAR